MIYWNENFETDITYNQVCEKLNLNQLLTDDRITRSKRVVLQTPTMIKYKMTYDIANTHIPCTMTVVSMMHSDKLFTQGFTGILIEGVIITGQLRIDCLDGKKTSVSYQGAVERMQSKELVDIFLTENKLSILDAILESVRLLSIQK